MYFLKNIFNFEKLLNIEIITILGSILILKLLSSKNIIERFFSKSDPREFLSMGNHSKKTNIPFFGGIAFFLSLIPLYFYSLKNPSGWLIFFSSFFSGLVGFYDDLKKFKKEKGLNIKKKFFLQALGSIFAVFFWYNSDPNFSSTVFFGKINFEIGIFYIFWAAFVIISTSHAINLTDGLDGLATSQSIITLIGLFIVNNFYILDIVFQKQILFLMPILFIFLIKNYHPAKIFMGDIGSLFLGGYISALFLIKKLEILLIISGGIFVIETVSCVLQIFSYKFFKKKLFLFAPIHHDFEKRGFSEKKIFYIFGFFGISFQLIFILLYKKFYLA